LKVIEKFVKLASQKWVFFMKYFFFLLLIAQWNVLGALETSTFRTRQAQVEDLDALFELVCEFGQYEGNELDTLSDIKANLGRHAFGQTPDCYIELAENQNGIVGFALYTYIYSALAGAPYLYLEELYVKRSDREVGIGSGLMKQLARYAKDKDCCCMQWHVFDWNDQAISFYHSLRGFIRGNLLLMHMDEKTYSDLAESL
jgi:ribosomal protein S18 acetylase RimI-like enzyme